MWAIWWARRRDIHDNEFQSPISTWCFINKYLEELEIASTRPNIVSPSSSRASHSRWLPPDDGFSKMNVDGGLSRQGDRGCAAVVCRDKTGQFLGASTLVFDGLKDPASLEAQACNEALALAQDLNIQQVVTASDCLEVITNIKKGAATVYASVLHDIQHRTTNFRDVSFRFEHREFNFETHALAKAASSLAVGRHVWPGILPDIICIPNSIVIE